MCCLAIADNTEDNESFAILGNVTVLDDLATEREMATRMSVTGGSRSAVAKLNTRWRRNKKWRNKMAAVPDVIEVTTPAVGTMPQCTVRMLSEARQHKPGFAPVCMEITGESLTWLASAIEWQYTSNEYISRRKQSKMDLHLKRANPDSPDGDESDDEQGSDTDTEQDAEMGEDAEKGEDAEMGEDAEKGGEDAETGEDADKGEVAEKGEDAEKETETVETAVTMVQFGSDGDAISIGRSAVQQAGFKEGGVVTPSKICVASKSGQRTLTDMFQRKQIC